MSPAITRVLRGVAGLVAAVAGYYAIYNGVIVLDIVTRPVNRGWWELLALLLTPIFLGVGLLLIFAIVLGRYAWRGRVF